jgi:type IV pilus assembly protein PilV
MISLRHCATERGFSLMEVMVSLVVISAGLLGVAKMQAVALASTTVASMRSMAAIEAASLASVMHQNRGYWGSTAPAAIGAIVVSKTGKASAPTISAVTLTGATDCAAGVCTAPQLAGYDLQQWALELQQVLPNYQAAINCTSISPVTCTININWTERAVALTKQEAVAQAAAGSNYLQAPNYTLFVQP